MMMRANANTVSASRVGGKTGSVAVPAPRRVVSVAASKQESKDASSTMQDAARSGLAAVSAFCLGVSLLISPVEPAQAVLPPDNGAELIKSGANALPQPLNKLTPEKNLYKDPATEAKKDKAQYSDVDYTKKASDKIKGGLENIKEKVTGAAEDVKSNASDAASDIKSSANKLGNKVAFLGVGENAGDKVKEGSKDIANNARSANAFLAGKASKAVDNVKEATGNAVENVKSGASNVSDKAENGFSKVDMSRVNLKQDNSKKVALLGVGENAVDKVQDGAKDIAASTKKNAVRANDFFKGKAAQVTSVVSDRVEGGPESIKNNAYLTGGKVTTRVSNSGSTDIPGNAYLQSKLGRDVKAKVDSDVQATKNTAASIKNDGYTQAKEGAKDVLKNVANGSENAKSVNAFIKDKAGDAKKAISNKADDLGVSAKDAARNVKSSANQASNQVNVSGNSGSTDIQGNAFLRSKLGRDVKAKVDGDVQATKNTASSVSNNGLTQVKEGAKDAVDNVTSSTPSAKSVNAFIKNKASAAKDAITDKVQDLGSAAKDSSKNI